MSCWQLAEPEGQLGCAIWHVDLANVIVAHAAETRGLSEGERARAARFLRVEDRNRFIFSHLALRRILAGYLARPPEALRFRRAPGGKPDLDGPDRGRLHFNLSHSGSHALIGIARDVAIGVDVEEARPIGDPMAIARAHFHPGEVADLEGLPKPLRDAAFLACWTRKEAVVKALGTGLALPLSDFRVSVPPEPVAVLAWATGPAPSPGWSLHHLAFPDATGTVAIARPGEPCALYRLAADQAEGR